MGEIITVFIGLGSNLGNRDRNISDAIALLRAVPGVQVKRVSQTLETKPVGPVQDQPDFMNAVAAIETSLAPIELLDQILLIETKLGRQREERWGPRLIDLDILLYGNETIDHPRLTVPHPEIHNRSFVREALQELGAHG